MVFPLPELKSAPRRRLPMELSSNSVQSEARESLSFSVSRRSSKVTDVGTSRMIFTSSFERCACSLKLMTFSFCFPFSLWELAMRPSTES